MARGRDVFQGRQNFDRKVNSCSSLTAWYDYTSPNASRRTASWWRGVAWIFAEDAFQSSGLEDASFVGNRNSYPANCPWWVWLGCHRGHGHALALLPKTNSERLECGGEISQIVIDYVCATKKPGVMVTKVWNEVQSSAYLVARPTLYEIWYSVVHIWWHWFCGDVLLHRSMLRDRNCVLVLTVVYGLVSCAWIRRLRFTAGSFECSFYSWMWERAYTIAIE